MFSIYLIPFSVAMFLAFNMGGSGTAPSFSCAYGSNIIQKKFIPGLFTIFVFLGAIFAGKKVIVTMSKGVLPAHLMSLPLTTIILLSISLSLLLANLLRVPQSTSQSAIFALIGPAIYFNMLQTNKLFFEIIPVWFLLPIIAFFSTLFIGKYIYNPIKKRNPDKIGKIYNHFLLKVVIVLASCYVAFAIGSNNVANAAGPMVSMISNKLAIPANGPDFVLIMILTTLIIAPCFGIGSSFFGCNVMKTTGKEIVHFGPLGATLVSIITATLLLLASVTRGIPTSLVQVNAGAIIALGISKVGWKNIDHKSVKKIFSVWVIAPLIALSISYLLTIIADKLGLLF